MIVALDNSCLACMSSKRRGEDVQLNKARLEHLLQDVADSKGRVIIPAPAFAEFLVGINEAAAEWINVLDRKRSILIAPFDRRAAFECSILDKAAHAQGDKRGGRKDAWQRIKIDRQIVAVARLHQATVLITNDIGLRATATAAGITARRIEELPVPDSAKQHPLVFAAPDPEASIAPAAQRDAT